MSTLIGELPSLALCGRVPFLGCFPCLDAMQFKVGAWLGSSLPKLFPLFPESQPINQFGPKARKRNGILEILAFCGEC